MPDVAELLARATDAQPLSAVDGKSGASLERVVIDGEAYVVKRVAYANDWLMQAIGDRAGAAAIAWEAGLMDRLPPCIDHTTVAMARTETDGGVSVVIVMRDVAPWLVPDGDGAISIEQHRRFIEHMAQLQASFWGWIDDVGLIDLADRYSLMTRRRIEAAASASPDAVAPPLILDGWAQLPERAPAMADVVFALHEEPGPLIDALRTTPSTFIHGDWKLANLGTGPGERTILVDWSFPGAGPATAELAHYLALNYRRLPESREASIETYRAALEAAGVSTDGWWDRQLALSLLGIMCNLGWEKARAADRELQWWEARVAEGAALL